MFPMASITSTETSSSSSLPRPKYEYDVFLSFRGKDTRNNFADHLYAALDRKGIKTFRDDEELDRGKSIRPELLKAIEESRFAVTILSRNYASSTWCLDELAKIVECMKQTRLTVLPVFYGVNPSDVRQAGRGSFEKAFERFKENRQRVQRWIDALREVADVSGWHLQDR
ncbi:disease resistance protein RPV1-like [Alnus glutinosa]|uniref:disease resistance protein RPV1-like n=1 Tax=Alnus glutinosa TaxID=3517 RepID=UPI002D797EC1|nr:disease resistance protein RPV1-like [Alnus glutinosa]